MKISPVPKVAEVVKNFRGVLLDAYGVFWGGNRVGILPGAADQMKRLVDAGKIVGILSNSTHLSSSDREKYERSGLVEEVHFHFIVTSGDIARRTFLRQALPFKTPRNQFCSFCTPHPQHLSHESLFHETIYSEVSDWREADFLYLSTPHLNGEDQTDPGQFWPQVKAFQETRLPMVCVNPDRFAHEGNPPRAVVRQGCIAAMYEEIGGSVFRIGKPERLPYSTAMEQFAERGIVSCRDVLMIGDTPETDIRGARRMGMSTALVTGGGIMGDRLSGEGGLESERRRLAPQDKPDHLIHAFSGRVI